VQRGLRVCSANDLARYPGCPSHHKCICKDRIGGKGDVVIDNRNDDVVLDKHSLKLPDKTARRDVVDRRVVAGDKKDIRASVRVNDDKDCGVRGRGPGRKQFRKEGPLGAQHRPAMLLIPGMEKYSEVGSSVVRVLASKMPSTGGLVRKICCRLKDSGTCQMVVLRLLSMPVLGVTKPLAPPKYERELIPVRTPSRITALFFRFRLSMF
jgi:hypothetical protein